MYHGATNFKKEYAKKLQRFEKIYIHDEGDNAAKSLIKKVCQLLPYEKLYKIKASAIDSTCKDLADLHVKGLLNEKDLLGTAVKIDKDYFDEVNNNVKIDEHVKLAEEVLSRMYIKYYNEDFYVYENGVYRPNLSAIESCIQSIDKNTRRSMQAEILNYIRIKTTISENLVDKNLINFKNGLFNLTTGKLGLHDPNYFTICQLNVEYLSDGFFEKSINDGNGKYIDKFLSEICCGKNERIDTLLEYIGYSMTYLVNLKKCLFIVGSTADNGKSTFLELVTALFGSENVSNVSIAEFSERFCGSDLVNKLLNVYHEIENIKLKNMAKFKIIVAGNELYVEEKYKKRFKMKPFAHHIFAMNNLPTFVGEIDEGFFTRLDIINFEAKFSDVQKEEFDFNNLITENSLDYLANLALRKYLKMRDEKRQKFSNYEESEKMLSIINILN